MELDFDGSFNYGRNTSKEELNSGFPLFSGILPLLNSGRVNLFGPNTPEITQEVRATNFIGKTFDSKLDGYGVNVKGSGEIYTLPAGPIALAVGMHAGKEKLSQNPNPILQTGDISGYGGNLQPIDNSRTVWAVFGEVNIPIVKTLEGNVAVRYDRYDDFGSTTNPKVSLRWQPTRKLLLRGAGGTGFLAPTLFQLYNPQTPGLSQPGISDPLRCPVNDPNNADCQTQYTATFGGNSSLKPQKAKQTTLGAIFEPVDGVSLAADWFDLDLEDIITNGVPIGTILDPATYGQYSGLVTRAASCAPTSGAPNLPCPITAIDQRFVNLGRVKVQGIDIDARFSGPATDLGRFGSYRRHVLHQVRPPAARRQFQRFDLQRLSSPRKWHHAAVEELRLVIVGARSVVSDPRQHAPEFLRRRAG